MVCYELTRKGFYGDNDRTDDLILWIAAPSETEVRRLAAFKGWDVEKIEVMPFMPFFSWGLDFCCLGIL
jgi:hypothetical protein